MTELGNSKMAFEEFQVDRIEDKQAGLSEELYKCSDGKMRTAYARTRFEERVLWTWLGFIIRDDSLPRI
jgi:hypothetical protein